MRLLLDRYPSPVGHLLLVHDEEGLLRGLDFGDYEERMHRLLRRHYGETRLEQAPAPAPVRAALEAYFGGDYRALDVVRTATGGTDFQRAVWAQLRLIPPGETLSYGALAARVGSPQASRAVGLANGSNPIAIVVPCHRVIGANGTLTGFGGGLPRKKWLLEHERALERRDLFS